LARKDERRGHYRAAKKKMMAVTPHCYWCKRKLTMEIGSPNQATLDHKIPLALGGLDNANNWVLACEPCNHDRGSKMPELKEGVYAKSG
jgi:5-methylcytosine-specific restriction endonuclease McrA